MLELAYRDNLDCKRDYYQALESLAASLKFGINPSLESVQAICAHLGDPQMNYLYVQVAGTNGKSSSTRMFEAIMRAHGRRTGLYTSPELVEYRERIERGGCILPYQEFADLIFEIIQRSQEISIPITEFEILTLAALRCFDLHKLDIAVMEVGLGGRWDATSVRPPDLALITGIGLDHMAILGNSLVEIAGEKAAIIKEGTQAFLGEGILKDPDVLSVFLERAAQVGAPLQAVCAHDFDTSKIPAECKLSRYQVVQHPAFIGDNLKMRMRLVDGRELNLSMKAPLYQAQNIALCVCATAQLLGEALDEACIQQALDGLRIPGRFELVSQDPLQLIDAAHNPQSIEKLIASLNDFDSLDASGLQLEDLRCVFAAFADKDVASMLELILKNFKHIVLTSTGHPRCMPVDKLRDLLLAQKAYKEGYHIISLHETVEEFLEAFADKAFLACGSITLAAKVNYLSAS